MVNTGNDTIEFTDQTKPGSPPLSYHPQQLKRVSRDSTNTRVVYLSFVDRSTPVHKIVCASPGQRERVHDVLYGMFFDSTGQTGQLTAPLTVFCATWNMGDNAPPASLEPWIPSNAYDVYCIATQECTPIIFFLGGGCRSRGFVGMPRRCLHPIVVATRACWFVSLLAIVTLAFSFPRFAAAALTCRQLQHEG